MVVQFTKCAMHFQSFSPGFWYPIFVSPILHGHGRNPVCPVPDAAVLGATHHGQLPRHRAPGAQFDQHQPTGAGLDTAHLPMPGDPTWVLKHVKLSRSVPKNKKIQYIQQSNTVFPHFFRFGCLGLGPALYSEVQKLHQHQGALPCWDVFSMFSSGTSGEAGSLFCKYLD